MQPISFFEDIDNKINIFTLIFEIKTFMIIGLSIFSFLLLFIFYQFYRTNRIKNRLKERDISINTKKHNKSKKSIFQSLESRQLQLKFIHSNYTLGINSVGAYYLYKIIFAVLFSLVGVVNYNKDSIIVTIMYVVGFAVFGYLLVDILMYFAKLKRIKKINEEMPHFLIEIHTYSKADLLFEDILDVIPTLISGPLQEEVVRFNVSFAMTKDFESCVKDFIERLGTQDGPNIELKLRQAYYTGVFDDVLSDEKELIEKKVMHDLKKETELFNIYFGLALCLLIFNIYLLILKPLMGLLDGGISGAF
ncbi:MAG: hypothetical protein ACOCRX_01915 [Candidatus Woesearchaeota archaeon]